MRIEYLLLMMMNIKFDILRMHMTNQNILKQAPLFVQHVQEQEAHLLKLAFPLGQTLQLEQAPPQKMASPLAQHTLKQWKVCIYL